MSTRTSSVVQILGLAASVFALAACGDDSETGSGGGGSTSTTTAGNTTTSSSGSASGGGEGGEAGAGGAGGDGQGANGSGGQGGSGGAGEGGAGQGGAGGGSTSIPCGDDICVGGDICVLTQLDPDCTGLEKGDTCPEGTEETQCGGAGFACCCPPPPDPTYACAAPLGCEDEAVSCQCLESPCDEGLECVNIATEGTVKCSPPLEA